MSRKPRSASSNRVQLTVFARSAQGVARLVVPLLVLAGCAHRSANNSCAEPAKTGLVGIHPASVRDREDSPGLVFVARDQTSGQALDAVRVSVLTANVVHPLTDSLELSSGNFWNFRLPAASYRVGARKAGYYTLSGLVAIRAGFRDTLFVAMQPIGFCIIEVR
jgi:hypothetical protein